MHAACALATCARMGGRVWDCCGPGRLGHLRGGLLLCFGEHLCLQGHGTPNGLFQGSWMAEAALLPAPWPGAVLGQEAVDRRGHLAFAHWAVAVPGAPWAPEPPSALPASGGRCPWGLGGLALSGVPGRTASVSLGPGGPHASRGSHSVRGALPPASGPTCSPHRLFPPGMQGGPRGLCGHLRA